MTGVESIPTLGPLPRKICVTDRVAQIGLYQYGAAGSIEGIDGVALRRNVDDIVLAPIDRETGHNKGLRIDLVVESDGLQQSESRFYNVALRQRRFVLIPAGAVIVVVIGRDVDLRLRRAGGRQA